MVRSARNWVKMGQRTRVTLPPLVVEIAWPACKPPPSDSVPHRRSIVVAAANRSPRYADGSLGQLPPNCTLGLSASHPPACCRHKLWRSPRMVSRRRRRPLIGCANAPGPCGYCLRQTPAVPPRWLAYVRCLVLLRPLLGDLVPSVIP